jgi:hypothetical protein
MSITGSIYAVLGLGIAGGLGYVWYEYLGGKTAIADLFKGAAPQTFTPGTSASWICQTLSIGCPASTGNSGPGTSSPGTTTDPSETLTASALDQTACDLSIALALPVIGPDICAIGATAIGWL